MIRGPFWREIVRIIKIIEKILAKCYIIHYNNICILKMHL